MVIDNENADIAITNAYILPMGDLEPIINGTVLIKNKKIIYAGKSENSYPWIAEKIIDAQGNVVMPGFVNCHTHIASNILLRGLNEDFQLFEWLKYMWKMKKNFDSETLYLANLVGLIEMVKSGTTCFNEHFDAYFVSPQLEALKEIPLRATLGYGFADKGIYSDITKYSWKTLDIFSEKVEMYHKSQDGRVHVALSPHATYSCGEKMWRQTRIVADELNVTIHTHLAEGIQELKYVGEKYGTTPTQWLASLGILGPDLTVAHCTKLNTEDIKLLADSGTKVAHCPVSNAKLCSGYMPIKEMLEAGINIGLATDGPASHNTLDMFQEMKFASIIHKNNYLNPEILPLRQMLNMSTTQSAIAMNRPETGVLTIGKSADLIIVNINNSHCAPTYDAESALLYSSRADDVLYTIVDGKVLMENKSVLGINESEIIYELKKKAFSLKERSLSN